MKDKWISVKERLPELHERKDGYRVSDSVLVFCPGCFDPISVAEYEDDRTEDYPNAYFGFVDNGGDCIKPTHWMPLPDPPKES